MIGWIVTVKSKDSFNRKDVIDPSSFSILLAYIFISYCVTGAFSGQLPCLIITYMWPILLWCWFYWDRGFLPSLTISGLEIKGTKWLQYLAAVIVIILVLTLILINIHGELNGANARFPKFIMLINCH